MRRVCFLLILLLAAPSAHAALRTVWAVDDGEKILRDDLHSPLKTQHNSVWDGALVDLSGARNEVIAFQLILEADGAGATGVNVTVSDVSDGTHTIRGSHPLPAPNDTVGVGVELFTEHYLHIETPSWNDPNTGGLGWNAFNNPHLTGWTPDALVPFSATPGRGGAPFDIAPDSNQGVWVDIYLPKENLAAGRYTGTITVTADGGYSRAIPLQLEVLDLELPDENHYRTMVFFSDYIIGPRYGLAMGSDELWNLLLDFHRMAHRHRIDLVGSGSHDEADRVLSTLTGEAYARAQRYQGPGEGVGNSLFVVNTYGWTFAEDEQGYRAESDAWENWFAEHAPNTEHFLYLIDEPGESYVPWMVERAGWIHNNPGPGRNLPVFTTAWPYEGLLGSIDMWSWPAVNYGGYPENVEAAAARGEPVSIYAAYRPYTPADCTDEDGIAWRAKAWIGHAWAIPRWFTWESTHWEPNSNEVPNDQPKNVWVNPVTFTTGDPDATGNGDGTLFYPGRDVIFSDQDRGYPGPIPSIRLKMYRRGIQDVEYMWLAEQAGRLTQVEQIHRSAVPASLWALPGRADIAEVPARWSRRNADYEAGRRLLASLIRGLPLFSDVPDGFWAKRDVEACALTGLVRGYRDGTYRPAVPVTRDQMAVYLVRALVGGEAGVTVGPGGGPGVASFPDVPTNHWAFLHIEFARRWGIVTGYPDGSYRPTEPVDRGQMAVYISRSVADPTGDDGLVGYTPPETPSFTDVPASQWAHKYVEYAHSRDIVNGYEDGTYRPDLGVTRDQMAVYVARAFGL